MSKIKILYISHSSEIAGAEICLMTLLKYLDRDSFEPVVVFPTDGALRDKIQPLGVKTYIIPLDWWVKGGGGFTCEGHLLNERVQFLIDIINAEKPDIIHTNTSVVWEGAIAAKMEGIPHIWHLHEKIEGHPSLRSLLPLVFVYRMIDLLSDKVVVVSNSVKRQISSIMASDKLLIINNGIDVDQFKSDVQLTLREELGVADDTCLAVSAGSLLREKGYDTLLEVASIVTKKGFNVKFVIAGEGTPETKNQLMKNIADLGLNDSVYYLGFRSDMHNIIKSAGFIILPSLSEAFPLVVLEAMAAGKPVIATDCGGPAEMVVDGETGFIVSVGDIESLCKKIEQLFSDKAKTLEMGNNALKRFNEKYRAEIYAGRFETLYRELADAAKSQEFSKEEKWLFDGLLQVYQSVEKDGLSLQEKDRQLAEKDHQITEKGGQLVKMVQQFAEKDHQIAEKDQQIAEKDQQLQAFLNSRSYRITAPLRWVVKPFKDLLLVLKEKIEKIFFLTHRVLISLDNAFVEGDYIEVVGWAISPDGIDRVEVYCDNTLVGYASYGHFRADVQKEYSFIKNSGNCGFFLSKSLEKVNPNVYAHTLLVKAIACSGQSVELERKIAGENLYTEYLKKTTPTEATLRWMCKASKRFLLKPSISLALKATEETFSFLTLSVNSITDQSYPFWDIVLLHEKELPEDIKKELQPLIDEGKLKIYPLTELNKSLDQTKGDLLGFICAGDILAPHALFEVVKGININNELELIYTDDDIVVDGKRLEPFMKPDWSPDLLLSMNYIGRFFLLKKELFIQMRGLRYGLSPKGTYDLLLRATECSENIGHIPLVLFTGVYREQVSAQAGKEVLEETLVRRKIEGEVIALSRPGTFRVKRKILGNPEISIIILTSYENPEKNLKACLYSIVHLSTYQNYEIVLIDNSLGKLPLEEIKELIPESVPLLYIKHDRSFNFSYMNNMAAEKANGDFIIFLNDDIEVVSSDWIESMLEHAKRPEVGIVGSKILYENGTVRHGGLFFVDNSGGIRHAFHHTPNDGKSYHGLLDLIRNCSAVTFDCIMISKDIFLELKGLDEGLRGEYSNADYCLRATKAGYLVIFTPHTLIYHKSYTSKRKDYVKENIDIFWNRWRKILEKGDPYYNPNLTLDNASYTLNTRPVLIEHNESYLLDCTGSARNEADAINPGSIHKILVIKLDHIGDVILSLPAVKLLRSKFPKANITMLVGGWAKPLLEKLPYIDEIIVFNYFNERSEDWKSFLSKKEIEVIKSKLQSYGFDLVIDLRKDTGTEEIFGWLDARYKVGYQTDENKGYLSHGLPTSEEMKNIPAQVFKPHITTQLCKLVQSTLYEKIELPSTSSFDCEFKFEFECEEEVMQRFSSLLKSRFLVGIHPGTGASIRQWPTAHFAELADMLIERYDAKVVFFGVKSEEDKIREVIGHMKHDNNNVVSLAGLLTMKEFMFMVTKVAIFIGNVSGPGHIAGVFGVPTLLIFAGQVTPYEWHPLGQNTMNVRMGIPCAPCYKAFPEQCPYDLKCLKFLWPEKVLSAVEQLLAISGSNIKRTYM